MNPGVLAAGPADPAPRRIELHAYRRDGLIVAPVAVPPPMLRRMRGSLDRLLENSADIAPESLICPHIRNGSRHPAADAEAWFEYATQPRKQRRACTFGDIGSGNFGRR